MYARLGYFGPEAQPLAIRLAITQLRWFRSSKTLASGNRNHIMRLWLAGWSSLINRVCHELKTINRTMQTLCSHDLGQQAVEKVFTNRVKSLKSHWKKDALSQTVKATEQFKHSQKQCKYQVSFQHFHPRNATIAHLWSVIPTSLWDCEAL